MGNRENIWAGALPKHLNKAIFFAVCAVAIPCLISSAQARRVALVVGNSNYEIPDYRLPNPANDARDVSQTLRDVGFDVIEAIDQDYRGMRRALQSFGRELADADAGLFFYAGHGMEFRGINYLVPTDAELQTESDVYVSLMSMNDILRTMESSVATRLIVLDACRDNPLARTLKRSLGASRSTSVGNGLAKVDAAVGTLIAYSTAPGQVAADGDGENSPFTSALLEHLPTPGIDAREIFTRVRRDVVHASDRQQVPWESSSLLGNFYFVEEETEPEPEPAKSAAAEAPAMSQPEMPAGFDSGMLELRAWELAQTLQTKPAYEAYKSGFCPGGRFCAFADLMLQSLVVETPPSTPAPSTPALVATRGEVAPQTPDPAVIEPAAGMSQVVEAVQDDLQAQIEEQAEAEQIVELAALAETLPEAEPAPEVIAAPQEAQAKTEPALPTPQTIEIDLKLSREMWRDLQDRLTRLGFDTKGVDGLPGARTRQAVSDWQEGTEFEATGYFNAETLDALLTAELPEPEPERLVAGEPEDSPSALEEVLQAAEAIQEPEAALPAVEAEPVAEPEPEPVPEPVIAEPNPDDEVAAPVVISTITEGPTDPQGQLRLGMAYLTGQGAEKDEKRAVQWLTFAAEQGEVTAQSVLGTLYDEGRGTPENDAEAVRWYKAAAEQGDLAAQFNLGVMYANGHGTGKDEAEAFRWFMEAAARDDIAAVFNVAVRYAEGRGVARNEPEAVRWYRRAAQAGDADAQLNLGVMYADGRGVPQDDAQAVLWYGKSAEQGHPQAQFNLALMYETGRGVEKDEEQAAYWFDKAATPR